MSSYIRTSDHLTVVFDDGETATVYTSQDIYPDVVEALRAKDFNRVRRLAIPSIELREKISNSISSERVKIEGGIVYLDDVALHNTLTDRMIEMVEEGFDIAPMAAFLANLMDNPSFRAVTELYDFLENSDLPITEDGHFVAYKRVRTDYMDQHSGSFDNSIGQVCEMPRNAVDEDKNRTCSAGLHFCSRSYLSSYGSSGGGRVMIVKINPRDVVAIPADYNNAKGRTCRYEVIGELELVDDSYGALPEEELEGSFRPDPNSRELSPPTGVTGKKAVEQYALGSNIVMKVFASASEAMNQTGVDSSSISKVCRGERKAAGGYGWRYIEDVQPTRSLRDEDMEDLDDPEDYENWDRDVYRW